MIKISDHHKLKKTKTTEMSREELNAKLRETARKSAKKGYHSKPNAIESKKQEQAAKKARTQMPPQSPARRKRELETRRRAEIELKESKKKKRGGNNIIYYVMLTIFVVTVFSILSVTVLFNMEKIIVEGSSDYTEEEIIAASGLIGDENLVTLDLKGVDTKILDTLVKLDSVKVAKAFPNAVKITVTPSVAMASYLYDGKNYLISHTGRIMEENSNTKGYMQIVGYTPEEKPTVGKFISSKDKEQDKLIAEIYAALEKANFTDRINKLDISDNLSIVLSYEDRVFIDIGSQLRIDEKLIIAKELISGGHIGAEERVKLDISNPEKVIQRPVTDKNPDGLVIPARAEETSAGNDEEGETAETSAEEEAKLD